MIYEIMKELKNFFPHETVSGHYVISDGHTDIPFLKDNQYFLIEGSTFNDGVHRYGEWDLEDEEFYGKITSLAPPKEFIALCKEIEQWVQTEGKKANGVYQSESFNGYSYSLKSDSSGGSVSWKTVFKGRLNVWRKM